MMILPSATPASALRKAASLAQVRYATSVKSSAQLAELQRQARELDNRPPSPPKQRGSDRAFYLTTIALFLVTPPICWFWFQHRKEHMGRKKEELLRQMEVKRKEFLSKREQT